MASINDVNNSVNKVNTTLHKEIDATNAVQTSVDNLKASVDNVSTRIDNLDGDLVAGFSATVQRLKDLEIIGIGEVDLLFHLTQQADTMICALNQISQNTCGILTQVTIQTDIQKRLLKETEAIRFIDESANPAAALESQRLKKLKDQIEKCCPSQPTPPACTYQPCPSPKQIGRPSTPNPGNDSNPNRTK